MNYQERIYEMLVYPDPIEEDLKSAAASAKRAVSHPMRAARRALTSRLPKTGIGGKARRAIAGARRKFGLLGRETVGAGALLATALAANASAPKAHTLKTAEPVPIERSAETSKHRDIKTRIERGKK